jgi:hypothetical protein
MEKLEKLWQTQKTICIILGIILLPITLLIIGTKLYMMYNEFAAKKSLEGAQKKDDKLAAEEDALKKASDGALKEADKAAQRIEDRHADDAVDLDWNKKRND